MPTTYKRLDENGASTFAQKIFEKVDGVMLKVEEMTLAEYNALTSAEKNDGTIRFITDVSDIPSATGVNF